MKTSVMKFLNSFLLFILIIPITSNAATTIWRIDTVGVTDVTSNHPGISALTGAIQYIDLNNGLWFADKNTITNSAGTLSHTFSGNIVDITSTRSSDFGLALLDNGQIWRIDTVGVTDVTSNHPGISALTGAIQYIDLNNGLWFADENTITNSAGTLSHTFSGNIVDITSTGSSDFGLAAVSPVPIPSAIWLFSSGLIGLVGIARRKKA